MPVNYRIVYISTIGLCTFARSDTPGMLVATVDRLIRVS
jgi:hypothetical protein